MNADSICPKPSNLFKTLRRLHGQNLENQGLNNLTEAFQNFMTRAKYFSIGRIRRTWSHSAVEFLKYHDFAVATTSWYDESDDIFGCDPALSKVEVYARANEKGEKRIVVTNISPRATSNQLKSFFSKFGKVSSCHIPAEERRQSMYATLPRKNCTPLVAHIKFKKVEDVQRALQASDDELKFYDKVMNVSETSSLVEANQLELFKFSELVSENRCLNASTNTSMHSDVLTITELHSPLNSKFSMEMLPMKVLARVLYYLSPLDRIRVERVSKMFLEASAKAWAMSTKLSFRDDKAIKQFFTLENPMCCNHLQAFLVKCGVHLRSLDLSGITQLFDKKAFQIISSLCPKLREVNISGLVAESGTLRAFSDSLPCLNVVIYKDMAVVNDKEMWNLFRGNGVNIQKIDIRGCKQIRGCCLRCFSSNLEEVLLDGCSHLENSSLEDLCLRSSNVKVLWLSGCFRISDETIGLITRCMSYIESFSLCGDNFNSLTPGGLLALSRFNALTELFLDYNSAVSNELLDVICTTESCLKILSIAYAGTDLDLSSLAAVTNKVIMELGSKCSKLQTMRLRSCIYLGDEGVSGATNLVNLQELDLSGCILVTNVSIQALLDAFPANEGNSMEKKLVDTVKLVIGGTICQVSGLRTSGSRVVLDFCDNSALFNNSFHHDHNYLSDDSDSCITSEDDDSNDEFEAFNAHRAFIIGAQEEEEEISLPENDQSIREWAEREATGLGLMKTKEKQLEFA
uniref:F-box domain-containing protein n=1 Tax=Syphacia muris TaxID=451379 RepID=A0A158R659_9BILA